MDRIVFGNGTEIISIGAGLPPEDRLRGSIPSLTYEEFIPLVNARLEWLKYDPMPYDTLILADTLSNSLSTPETEPPDA